MTNLNLACDVLLIKFHRVTADEAEAFRGEDFLSDAQVGRDVFAPHVCGNATPQLRDSHQLPGARRRIQTVRIHHDAVTDRAISLMIRWPHAD